VDLPVVATSLKTLFLLIRLFLQTLIGVESTKEIPVQLPKQQVFANIVMGNKVDCISSTNRLYDTVFGKSFCMCFCT
jgi:hypothetical protein